MNECLAASQYFDYDHPDVRALAVQFTHSDAKQKAIEMYYWVRDEIRYNPYLVVAGADSFKASFCLVDSEGYCISKASLLIALCRFHGIPARIGLCDVKNHLSNDRLTRLIGSNVFPMHAYAELYIDGKWVKATPAFNLSLCEKFGLAALEFDGEQDAIFQAFTPDGRAHMEYVKEHGTFAQMPVAFMLDYLEKCCPGLFGSPVIQGQALELEK